MQLEMPILQPVGGMADVPYELVCQCNHQHEAVRLCMRNSRIKRSIESWADVLGMAKGTLSCLLNGGTPGRRRYFPPEAIEQIQIEAGNRAVSQWWDCLGKGMLRRQRWDAQMSEVI